MSESARVKKIISESRFLLLEKAKQLDRQITEQRSQHDKYANAAAHNANMARKVDEKIKLLTDERDAVNAAISDTTGYPSGKVVEIDVDRLSTAYASLLSSELAEKLVQTRMESLIKVFRILYPAYATGGVRKTRVWIREKRDVSQYDFTYIGGKWFDSDGKPLSIWRNLHIHDSGIAITKSHCVLCMSINTTLVPHDCWVTYTASNYDKSMEIVDAAAAAASNDMVVATDVSAADTIAIVDELSPRSCEHEDKKRRTVNE